MAEDSKPGPDSPGPILEELVTQRVAALATSHLERHAVTALLGLRLQLLGQAVRINWVLECGPRRVMFILLRAKY